MSLIGELEATPRFVIIVVLRNDLVLPKAVVSRFITPPKQNPKQGHRDLAFLFEAERFAILHLCP